MVKKLGLVALLLVLRVVPVYSFDNLFNDDIKTVSIAPKNQTSPSLRNAIKKFEQLLQNEQLGLVPQWQTLTPEQRLQDNIVWVNNDLISAKDYKSALKSCGIRWSWGQSGIIIHCDLTYYSNWSKMNQVTSCSIRKFNRNARKKRTKIEPTEFPPILWILSVDESKKCFGWLTGNAILNNNTSPSLKDFENQISLSDQCSLSQFHLPVTKCFRPVDDLDFLIDDEGFPDAPEQVLIELKDLEFLMPEMSIQDASDIFGADKAFLMTIFK